MVEAISSSATPQAAQQQVERQTEEGIEEEKKVEEEKGNQSMLDQFGMKKSKVRMDINL